MTAKNDAPLYCFGCPGKKSHGWLATARKLLGLMPAEPMKAFSPVNKDTEKGYEAVASLYAQAFEDIRVRHDEFQWLSRQLPKQPSLKILDIGCGNGALLKALSQQIGAGTGVDVSANLLQHAKTSHKDNPHIDFVQIDGPLLPFEDHTFDVVVSMLSFRYLDWDPIMREIARVTKENGKLIVIDMVTAPLKLTEIPQFVSSKFKLYLSRLRNRDFHKNLQQLTRHPDWAKMLRYNPIRSQHEMKWYLESRFPGQQVEVINVGLHSRILAFDSGNIHQLKQTQLSYP